MNPETARPRIEAVAARRKPFPGEPITDQQIDDAAALMLAMLEAAQGFNVSLDDFDWLVDIPGACFDAIRRRDSKKNR